MNVHPPRTISRKLIAPVIPLKIKPPRYEAGPVMSWTTVEMSRASPTVAYMTQAMKAQRCPAMINMASSAGIPYRKPVQAMLVPAVRDGAPFESTSLAMATMTNAANKTTIVNRFATWPL